MLAVLIAVGYALALIFFLSLCCAAADGDRAAQLLARDKQDS
jgi:hypothetical protein